MKPDWKDAPEWAQWLAQDGDGTWYWLKTSSFSKIVSRHHSIPGKIQSCGRGLFCEEKRPE